MFKTSLLLLPLIVIILTSCSGENPEIKKVVTKGELNYKDSGLVVFYINGQLINCLAPYSNQLSCDWVSYNKLLENNNISK
jgi:hypothetical protein